MPEPIFGLLCHEDALPPALELAEHVLLRFGAVLDLATVALRNEDVGVDVTQILIHDVSHLDYTHAALPPDRDAETALLR